jgi:hypothetical protein
VPEAFRAAAFDSLAAGSAQELMKVKIDALDITVLKGGAGEIGQWAKDHGFRLPPDAPEVLDFYASRSPIFLAAAFDADAAAERGQAVGDGTSVHITIPTPNPWVPLRILSLGKNGEERIEADVYLMTDHAPALLPAPSGRNGLDLAFNAKASTSLLDDLRSDRGMEWVPTSAWLSQITIDASAEQLAFDLAIDASGQGTPSRVQAGLEIPGTTYGTGVALGRLLITLSVIGLGLLLMWRVIASGQPGVRPTAGA